MILSRPRIRVLIRLIVILMPIPTGAQVDTASSSELTLDSTDVVPMSSVTIRGDRATSIEPFVDTFVPRRQLQATDATDVADAFSIVPAARVQVNSRGESNLYLRNAGERQTALYFDGALLNVPWDNRIDLALLPLNAVGGISIERGGASVLYGANTLGGAVNIQTRRLATDGSRIVVTGDAGEHGFLGFSGTYLFERNQDRLIATASFDRRDGLALPADASLPFSQTQSATRTNTDRRTISGYLRGETSIGESTRVGLSINVTDAEKGVAPEGHIDPSVGTVRFWRYTDWRSISLNSTINHRFGAGGDWSLRGALWTTLFSQTIDQFTDATYTDLDEQQQDDDVVVGSRVILSVDGEGSAYGLGVTQTWSRHDQIDGAVEGGGLTFEPTARYSQYVGSVGPEIRTNLGGIALSAGVGLDLLATLESGDKPKQEPFLEPGAVLSLRSSLDSSTTLALSIARKSRFPSLRELYGEALQRFLVNPDLKPESGLNLEAEISTAGRRGRIAVTPFLQIVDNTIDQRRVDTLGAVRRQRINLDGSIVPGIEVVGTLSIFSTIDLRGHATWSRPRQQGSNVGDEGFLTEKPELVASLFTEWRAPENVRLSVEANATGRSYGLSEEGRFTELPATVRFDSRISWIHVPQRGPYGSLEIFMRADNLLDTLTLPQLGLPSPGREIRGGVRLSL